MVVLDELQTFIVFLTEQPWLFWWSPSASVVFVFLFFVVFVRIAFRIVYKKKLTLCSFAISGACFFCMSILFFGESVFLSKKLGTRAGVGAKTYFKEIYKSEFPDEENTPIYFYADYLRAEKQYAFVIVLSEDTMTNVEFWKKSVCNFLNQQEQMFCPDDSKWVQEMSVVLQKRTMSSPIKIVSEEYIPITANLKIMFNDEE